MTGDARIASTCAKAVPPASLRTSEAKEDELGGSGLGIGTLACGWRLTGYIYIVGGADMSGGVRKRAWLHHSCSPRILMGGLFR